MKRIGHTPPFRLVIPFAGLILVISMLIFTGCSKSQVPATQTAAPAPQYGSATNGQPDLPALQRTLIRWIVGNRRMPTNFEDFAATAGVTIPPPPPGQKYIITPKMRIQLVNQ